VECGGIRYEGDESTQEYETVRSMVVEFTKTKYGFLKVHEIWFNQDKNFRPKPGFHVYFLKQSVKLKNPQYVLSEIPFHTVVLDLSKPLEEIWRGFSKKSTRYEINKAKKLGDKLTIKNNENIHEFLEICRKYWQLKYGERPKWGLEIFTKNTRLFTIYHEDEIVGGLLFIEDIPNRVRLFKSCSRYLESENMKKLSGALMRYLHWYCIRYYKELGARIYDLGGINLDKSSPTYNITKYKLSFGGEIVTEYDYILVRNRALRAIVKLKT